MFDISTVKDLEKVNESITNENFLNTIAKQYFLLVNICKDNEEFKRMSKDEQEYIAREIIMKNKQIIHNEIIRLLKITPEFITTKYFKTLSKMLRIYYELLNTYYEDRERKTRTKNIRRNNNKETLNKNISGKD